MSLNFGPRFITSAHVVRSIHHPILGKGGESTLVKQILDDIDTSKKRLLKVSQRRASFPYARAPIRLVNIPTKK